MPKLLTPLDQSQFSLLIIEDIGMRYPSEISKQTKRFALFKCPHCNNNFESEVTSVKKGRATKCKSCSIKNSKTTHGESKTRLHNIWISMKNRCKNENSVGYKNYGGRGITVCSSWHYYENFKNWALANGYSDVLSIDRINSDMGYTPENCRWTTRTVQARNTRRIYTTNKTGFRGVYQEGSKFVASIGIASKTLRLGIFETKEEAANAYDTFVCINNLEHTTNKTQ